MTIKAQREDNFCPNGTSGAQHFLPHFRGTKQAVETTDLVLSVASLNPAPKSSYSVGPPGETLSLMEYCNDRSLVL